MEQFCKEHGFVGWFRIYYNQLSLNRFETSAKDNIGIDKAAKFLISKILENKVTEKPIENGVIRPGNEQSSKSNSSSDEKKGCICNK